MYSVRIDWFMAVFIDSTHRPLIRLKLVQHSNNPHNRAIPVYDADLSTEQDSDVEELSHTVMKQEREKSPVGGTCRSQQPIKLF